MPVPAGPGPFTPPPDGPLVYDPTLSRVRLAVPGIPAPADWASVERSADQIRWATVRGGLRAPVVAGEVKLDDYEFAADVPNHYRISVPDVLNANVFFEDDASNWTAPAGSIVRSTAQAHEGVASLLLTPDGVSGSARTESERCPVSAGVTYHASAWVRCASSRNVEINIAWFTASEEFIAIAAAPRPVAANTWTRIEADHVAPSGAGLGSVQVRLTGTPPPSDLTWIDEAHFYGPDMQVLFTGSLTPTLDKVWLKSVERPFLNRSIRVRDYSEFTRPSRSGVFEVVGRSFPIAVTDVRSSKRFTLEVYAEDAADARDLDLVLASGDTMFLHVPSTGRLSTVPGGYVAVGDTSELVLPTADLNLRVFSLPCTIVAPPGPEVVGVTYTCQGVLNDYATCTDLLAAFATILDLLDNVGSAEDVIVP